MTDAEHKALAEQLTITVEICGTNWTPAAFKAVMMQLMQYPAAAAVAALQRCQLEVTGRLSLAAIIERIDDGRPTADEAWAQVGTVDEARTIVSTNEAMAASRELGSLIEDDPVAARMAFKDAYRRIMTENRASGTPPEWFASLGHNPAGRTGPIMQAVERGRLPIEHAKNLLGEHFPVALSLSAGQQTDRLGQQRVRGLLAGLAAALAAPGDAPADYVPPNREEVEQIRAGIEAAKKACA